MSSIGATSSAPNSMQQHQEQRRTSLASLEPNNNNNNNNKQSLRANRMPAKQLTRKRSSIQSNLSALSNGSGEGSLHSSSSTVTSGDDGAGNGEERASYSNADYDRIRNTTLLFFLDRLYLASREGKEPRTLHDLSCLFGTKEFSKDMRHIVGASRNGLKKFLQSYPSLFHIDGDKVYLTQLEQTATTKQRDYNQEAVDYFKLKLVQFGTSLVPIKNLFGHRSQANPEVRHVSGKNARDFKRFLKQNEHVFEILADEHVVLKSALAELESQGQSSLALEQSLQPLEPNDAIVADPYLNKQLAHQIEDCIKQMREEAFEGLLELEAEKVDSFQVNLEALLERIQKQCQNELFLKMVRSQQELKMFLRMHPKLFKRSQDDQAGDCVSLLSEQERKELELAARAYQRTGLQQRQHSTLERSISASSEQTHPNLIKSQAEHATSVANQDNTNQQQVPSACEPHSLPPILHHQRNQSNLNSRNTTNNDHNVKRQSEQEAVAAAAAMQTKAASQASQQLRAAAPPFVPSNSSRQNSASLNSTLSTRQQANLNATKGQLHDHVAPMRRSQSSLTSARPHGGEPTSEPVARRPLQSSYSSAHAPVNQRPAIRNYLMKGMSQSASHHNMNWSQASRLQQGAEQLGQENAHQAAMKPLSESELRARTVDIVREASNIISRIMATAEAVAFDCKGYNLGFDGQITLIQFGYLPTNKSVSDSLRLHTSTDQPKQTATTNNGDQQQREPRLKPEVCVFDLITNPELAYCLKPLLESDKIVKIVHDVRNKSNALYVQFKIILNNVFDTQVANLVIQQQDTGKPAYKSRYISMSKLCEIYGDQELMKYRNIIKHKTRHASTSNASNMPTSSGSSRTLKDVNYWRARPLTKPMIFEATMDVYCLVGGIYQNLQQRIKSEYEPLFEQLNREGVLARIQPEEIRSAKKERKIDLEVIDLKRKLYGDLAGPIVLSNREIRLLRHIDLTDEVRQKIQQCKKVAKKLERLDMKAAELKQEQQQQAGEAQAESLTSTSQFSSIAHTVDDLQSIECASLPQTQHQSQEEATFASKLDEFQATGLITNLMDSSMFDELKDKMIESSSLLESLEDDDDECISGGQLSSGSHHSHNGSLNHDCCGCQCHRGSSIDSSEPAAKSLEKSQTSASEHSKPSEGAAASCASETQTIDSCEQTGASEEATSDHPDAPASPDSPTKDETPAEASKDDHHHNQEGSDADSKSSLACDMAVQCDLLS